MILSLPKNKGNKKLPNIGVIHGLKNKFGYKKVNLKLPKFKLSTETKFKKYFEQIGMKRLFQNGAISSKMLSKKEKAFLSQIMQKTVIEVDEDEWRPQSKNEMECTIDTSACLSDFTEYESLEEVIELEQTPEAEEFRVYSAIYFDVDEEWVESF